VHADEITGSEGSQTATPSNVARQQGEDAVEHDMDLIATLDPDVSAMDLALLHWQGSTPGLVLISSMGIESIAVSSQPDACPPLVPDPMPAPDVSSRSSVAVGSDGYSAQHDVGSIAEHLESHDEIASAPIVPATTQPRTWLQSNIVKPKFFTVGTVRYDWCGMMVTCVPNSLAEALRDEN
jgi:hypothetical protein